MVIASSPRSDGESILLCLRTTAFLHHQDPSRTWALKGKPKMLTIDAQVHAYERNHPGRPWHAVLTGPPEVTGDQMVAAMDAVGVDGAVLVSPFTMYRYDASYALEVGAKHADRFCLVKPVDPNDPAVAEHIADWKTKKGTVRVRTLMHEPV